MAERLRDEAGPELKTTLWAATEILLGLYHPSERVRGADEGGHDHDLGHPRDRGIVRLPGHLRQGRAEGEARGRAEGEARGRAEGEVEEARKILLGLGRKKLGQPDEQVLAAIAAIGDLDRLNLLLDRILDVASWDELLAPADS